MYIQSVGTDFDLSSLPANVVTSHSDPAKVLAASIMGKEWSFLSDSVDEAKELYNLLNEEDRSGQLVKLATALLDKDDEIRKLKKELECERKFHNEQMDEINRRKYNVIRSIMLSSAWSRIKWVFSTKSLRVKVYEMNM
jgi:hypothetical protein